MTMCLACVCDTVGSLSCVLSSGSLDLRDIMTRLYLRADIRFFWRQTTVVRTSRIYASGQCGARAFFSFIAFQNSRVSSWRETLTPSKLLASSVMANWSVTVGSREIQARSRRRSFWHLRLGDGQLEQRPVRALGVDPNPDAHLPN